jgi:periplasmic protein TonB
MNFSKLNFKINAFITAVAVFTFTACNNSDETANNSPEGDTTVNASTSADTSVATHLPKKRRGIAAISIKEDDITVKIEKDKTGYYNRTEIAPAYPGGQNALENYINNSIVYPQEAIDNNAEGTVYVQFGVDENGNISNVSTNGKKLGYGLDEEAMRAVSQMPKWTPGQVKGKSVKTWRTLPVTYKLES